MAEGFLSMFLVHDYTVNPITSHCVLLLALYIFYHRKADAAENVPAR
jgi:hypothetical protein